MTWDEYERATAYRRPLDWRERPAGPDDIDLLVADFAAAGTWTTRREIIAIRVAPETSI